MTTIDYVVILHTHTQKHFLLTAQVPGGVCVVL